MDNEASVSQKLLEQALTLSPIEKVRLVEQIMATLEHDLAKVEKKPRRSLYGLWADVQVSEEDIAEARHEMWGNFPREDV
jgi:hypothetical protein